MDVNLRKLQNLRFLMVFCIKSIFYLKHTILKLCWANSHKVMSMILTSRYSPFAYFSTNLEMKRQKSTSVHIITFITFCINQMFKILMTTSMHSVVVYLILSTQNKQSICYIYNIHVQCIILLFPEAVLSRHVKQCVH